MSEMMERVARVLCVGWGVDPDKTTGGTFDGGSFPKGKPAWTHWEDEARAVIAAMREPTDAMVQAGADAGASYESEDEDFRDAWQAMIDAALS